MSDEWFVRWFDSPYYHILYQSHDDREARLFIDKLLIPLALPDWARLLDLGCGRGRHARYLAEHGFQVTGLDIAPSSIAFARRFEHDRLAFFQHDMRRPFRYNYFDAVLNIFTSFGYFNTEKEHLKILKNIFDGLKPGGLFLLDYFNSEWVRQNLEKDELKTLKGIDFHLKKTIRGGRIYKRVAFTTEGRKFLFRERVRLFELNDFRGLINEVGLKLKEVYGGYDLSPFNPNQSKRLILIAQKPG